MRVLSIFVAVALAAAPALAKKKKAKAAVEEEAPKKAPPNAKALADLAGKFKWGMHYEEIFKVLAEQLKERYAEKIKAEVDVHQQDLIRKEMHEEIDKVKHSHVKFDGQKSGWDVSIVDKEFRHKNGESMAIIWEKDQRRFLFFHNDKLYKQFIAFNAEHPAFQGKSFDDFSRLIEKRFGPSEMKFGSMRTKDEQQLDHLEWTQQGDTILWAIDQSQFYGNFCLVLKQASVVAHLEKDRDKVAKGGGNALIDSVTTRDKVEGDPNANVVDDLIVGGKKSK